MDDNKIYLNYGDAKIEQDAFLKAAADSVESYLQMQPWSNSRKNLFREAYSDLMSRGILGASNSTGTWKVQYGNDPIDIASKSKKQKEMYGEAAYFIQQQMQGLASQDIAKKREEEEKKSTVPVFSNSEFISQLESQIGFNKFGGQPEWYQTQWTDLDNNNRGIYETVERQRILADQLQEFADSALKNPEKFNFEGSPFKDMSDFQARISKAIRGLRGNTSLDRETINALNELGINPQKYFYTGANRMVTFDGKQMTLQEYNDLMDQQQSKQNIPEQQIIYDSNEPLQEESEESRESRDARIAAGMNRTLDEMNWGDIKFDFNFGKGDLLPNFVSIKDDKYLANELNGAIYDILSIADPEAFSGSALALKAANLREKNRPSGLSWEKALDYGSAVLGGVQGLGDAALATKMMTRLGKILVNSTRAVGILSAIVGTAESGKAAIEVINKLAHGEMPTLAEAQTFIVGLAGGIKGWRARNKAIAKEKYVKSKQQPTREQKYIELETNSGEKIKVELDTPEANALGEAYRNAETNAKGRQHILNNDKVKKALDSKGLKAEDVKISGEAGRAGDALRRVYKKPASPVKSEHVADNGAKYAEVKNPVSRFSPVERWLLDKRIQNGNVDGFSFRKFGRRLWGSSEPEIVRGSSSGTSSGSGSGTTGSSSSAGTPASGSSSTGSGTPSTTRGSSSGSASGTSGRSASISKPKSKRLSKTESQELKSTLSGENFSSNNFQNEDHVVGSVKGLGDLYGWKNSDGTHTLEFDLGKTKFEIKASQSDMKGKTLAGLRKDIMKKIDSDVPKAQRSRIKYELITLLKQNGYLKQGGTIDKQKIQRYKEFIKK